MRLHTLILCFIAVSAAKYFSDGISTYRSTSIMYRRSREGQGERGG